MKDSQIDETGECHCLLLISHRKFFRNRIPAAFRHAMDVEIVGQAATWNDPLLFLKRTVSALVLLDIDSLETAGAFLQTVSTNYPVRGRVLLTLGMKATCVYRRLQRPCVAGKLFPANSLDALLTAVRGIVISVDRSGAEVPLSLRDLVVVDPTKFRAHCQESRSHPLWGGSRAGVPQPMDASIRSAANPPQSGWLCILFSFRMLQTQSSHGLNVASVRSASKQSRSHRGERAFHQATLLFSHERDLRLAARRRKMPSKWRRATQDTRQDDLDEISPFERGSDARFLDEPYDPGQTADWQLGWRDTDQDLRALLAGELGLPCPVCTPGKRCVICDGS